MVGVPVVTVKIIDHNHSGTDGVYFILPPFQNDYLIVDVRLKMKWSIVPTVTTGTPTILQRIAQ